MEQVKANKVESTQFQHDFFCDDCGEFIGTTYECDDGYYPKLGEFELSLWFDKRYNLKLCLCDSCRAERSRRIIQALEGLGFIVD